MTNLIITDSISEAPCRYVYVYCSRSV